MDCLVWNSFGNILICMQLCLLWVWHLDRCSTVSGYLHTIFLFRCLSAFECFCRFFILLQLQLLHYSIEIYESQITGIKMDFFHWFTLTRVNPLNNFLNMKWVYSMSELACSLLRDWIHTFKKELSVRCIFFCYFLNNVLPHCRGLMIAIICRR